MSPAASDPIFNSVLSLRCRASSDWSHSKYLPEVAPYMVTSTPVSFSPKTAAPLTVRRVTFIPLPAFIQRVLEPKVILTSIGYLVSSVVVKSHLPLASVVSVSPEIAEVALSALV